jgi:hypothetical protein
MSMKVINRELSRIHFYHGARWRSANVQGRFSRGLAAPARGASKSVAPVRVLAGEICRLIGYPLTCQMK